MTAGVSQALDLICTLLTRPGDTIIVEEPSYFLALRIFRDHHLNIVGTPMDENGLVIPELEERVKKYNPKLVYTIPVYHNPTGVTLSADRREDLVRLSAKHDFLIVADEVYQLLAYTDTPPPPMVFFDTAERVISLGSFSKILAPGLRLGWMHASQKASGTFLDVRPVGQRRRPEPVQRKHRFQRHQTWPAAGESFAFENNLQNTQGCFEPGAACNIFPC